MHYSRSIEQHVDPTKVVLEIQPSQVAESVGQSSHP